jgi:hypothetical protein|tara:strand:+ start:30200 stop:30514 length:315 start_codon:yes stop_codon:yes gene_type:complete
MARTPETTMNPIGGIADFALNTNGRLIARAEPTGSTGVYNPHWLHHLPFELFLENLMSRNTLYLLLGALVVVVIGFAIYAYQQESQPDGVQIELNEQGLSVEGN